MAEHKQNEQPMVTLFVLGGLPGAGKSELAQALAQAYTAVYLRIDTIEQTIRDSGLAIRGPEGYMVAYRLASDNIRLGQSVVADSVNPIEITRAAWRDVARQAGVRTCQIEIRCSDPVEHRWRVESRKTAVANLRLPAWQDVVNREYEPWLDAHVVVDTAGQTPAQSRHTLLQKVTRWLTANRKEIGNQGFSAG